MGKHVAMFKAFKAIIYDFIEVRQLPLKIAIPIYYKISGSGSV